MVLLSRRPRFILRMHHLPTVHESLRVGKRGWPGGGKPDHVVLTFQYRCRTIQKLSSKGDLSQHLKIWIKILVSLLSCLCSFLVRNIRSLSITLFGSFLQSLVRLIQICPHFLFIKIGKMPRWPYRWPQDPWMKHTQWDNCSSAHSAGAHPHWQTATLIVPGLFAHPHTPWKYLAWSNDK